MVFKKLNNRYLENVYSLASLTWHIHTLKIIDSSLKVSTYQYVFRFRNIKIGFLIQINIPGQRMLYHLEFSFNRFSMNGATKRYSVIAEPGRHDLHYLAGPISTSAMLGGRIHGLDASMNP